MQVLLTKAFWKGIWIWCKANWKFILGFSIPVVLSIIWRRGNAMAILKQGISARDKMIDVEREAAGLESRLKDKATQEFVDSTKEIDDKHRSELERIEAERKAAESRNLSPDEATHELADKFDLRIVSDEDNE